MVCLISWHISLFSVSAKLLSENTFLASMMSNNFNFTCKILDANLNNKYQCKNKSYIIKL